MAILNSEIKAPTTKRSSPNFRPCLFHKRCAYLLFEGTSILSFVTGRFRSPIHHLLVSFFSFIESVSTNAMNLRTADIIKLL